MSVSLLLVVVACMGALSVCYGRTVRIDNASPRRDVNGAIMDVHDGNILLHNGTYYYYGNSFDTRHTVDMQRQPLQPVTHPPHCSVRVSVAQVRQLHRASRAGRVCGSAVGC